MSYATKLTQNPNHPLTPRTILNPQVRRIRRMGVGRGRRWYCCHGGGDAGMSLIDEANAIIGNGATLELVDYEQEHICHITPTTRLYCRQHFYEGIYMGWNLYAYTGTETLVETYNSERKCRDVKRAIKKAIGAGATLYRVVGN